MSIANKGGLPPAPSRDPMAQPWPASWDRLGQPQGHRRWIFLLVPYVLLALIVGCMVIVDQPTARSLDVTLVLCALAAAWTLWMVTLNPAWRQRPRVMGVYVAGLIAITALLVIHEPLFGFFVPAAYLYAFSLLPWPWRLAAVTAVAVVAATAQTSAADKATAAGLTVYIAAILINVLPMNGLTWFLHNSQSWHAWRQQTIEQLSEANRKLAATLAENAGLHKQLLTQAREAGVLDERQRMAREIHDTLAQGLTGIITQLQAAEQAGLRHLGGRDGQEPTAWRRHIQAATTLARESLGEARRSVHALRPEPLETARLGEALADVASRWSALHGIEAQVTTTGTVRPLQPDTELALLRTAQEALANVAKHADASRVGLTLSYMDHEIALDVRDDGRGFDPAKFDDSHPADSGDAASRAAGQNVGDTSGRAAGQNAGDTPGRASGQNVGDTPGRAAGQNVGDSPGRAGAAGPPASGGFGLIAMRQRIEGLSGTLQVESEPGAGTAISACVPAASTGPRA
jgi:signal transduction histidine kinase